MFNNFKMLLKFASKIYQHHLLLQKARDDQHDLQLLRNKLNNDYNPTSKSKIEEKENTLNSAKLLYVIRNEIIDAFSKGVFPYVDGFQVDEETDEETDEEMNTTITPQLESEESAEQRRNQPGKSLKILTPNQMLSRLPITLAQLKAGNDSGKLKNEIRQLLYSLYLSKNMTKQVYNNLINYK